ncbi:MAG: hypothetical protein KAI24_11720, partial [Planctomycetes bacterium]|nr:hypothetical protein [Planctomycetota bacterium]
WLRRVLLAATALVVGLNLHCFASGGHYHRVSLPVLLGERARADWVREQLPMRAAVDLVNGLNERRHPVAFFGPAYAAGLHADALFVNWYNFRFFEAVWAATSDDQLGALLAREGIWKGDRVAVMVPNVPTMPLIWLSRPVHAVGPVSVRAVRDEFRFRTELLQSPDFADAAPWQPAGEARVEAGVGATVTVAHTAQQRVAVEPGRDYRLSARVRAAATDGGGKDPGQARLQVNWIGADGALLRPDIRVVACKADAQDHSIELTAPAGATAAVVYASGHTHDPVVFERLSFRN